MPAAYFGYPPTEDRFHRLIGFPSPHATIKGTGHGFVNEHEVSLFWNELQGFRVVNIEAELKLNPRLGGSAKVNKGL
jgi:hypothetical protein